MATTSLRGIDLAAVGIPDPAFYVGRADDFSATVHAADAAADAAPLDAVQLKALCVQAPCGRGTETVLDTTQRNVQRVRDLSAVRVEWKGLDTALRAAGRQLMPGVGLRAELYSVLVYRPGDFFRPHRDSMKGKQHVGTLTVLLGPVTEYKGGDLILYRARESERNELATWRPTADGDWAMWFNTQYHEVLPVTEGTRMVACYNIFVDADAVGFKAVVPPTTFSPTSTLSGVPVEVLQRIAQFLEVGIVRKLSESCQRLHATLGDPVTLLTAYLQQRRAKIVSCCRAAGMTHVLLPLFHDYPLDGGSEAPLLYLRGRDRVTHAAAQAVFSGDANVVPCAYIAEMLSDTTELLNSAVVGRGCTANTTWFGAVQDARNHVDTELDSDVGFQVRPFKQSVPLFVPCAELFPSNSAISVEGLWGNGETIDVYKYHACVLAVQVQ
jgi:predicted 2-oxoglutarate/Fe(II)-dependent dioxygenase YbiX